MKPRLRRSKSDKYSTTYGRTSGIICISYFSLLHFVMLIYNLQRVKLTPFQCEFELSFRACTDSCNHRHNQDTTSPKLPHTVPLVLTPLPNPWQPLICLFSVTICLSIGESRTYGIRRHATWDRLILLRIILFRFIQIVLCIKSSLLFMAEQ